REIDQGLPVGLAQVLVGAAEAGRRGDPVAQVGTGREAGAPGRYPPRPVQYRDLDLGLPRLARLQLQRVGEQPPGDERARRVDLRLPAEVVALVPEGDPLAGRPP